MKRKNDNLMFPTHRDAAHGPDLQTHGPHFTVGAATCKTCDAPLMVALGPPRPDQVYAFCSHCKTYLRTPPTPHIPPNGAGHPQPPTPATVPQ